jgi:type I restriction enzyme S subunit
MSRSNWPTVSLLDVVSLRRGFDLPEPTRVPGRYPVLGSSGISGWHNEGPITGPGVTIGRSGASIGVATYTESDYWPLNTTLYVQDFHGNDPFYVYHLLKTIDFSTYNSGSAQPSLNRNFLSQVGVALPGLESQRDISRLLGALDGKIAANGRIADAALELAELHYTSKSTAKKGWYSIPLANTARWLSGGTPKTDEPRYWNGETPWISALSLKSPFVDDSDRKVTEEGAENGTRLVDAGVIIFVVRGSSLDTEFRIGITQRQVAFGQDCKALIPREDIDPNLLFLSIKTRSPEILGLVDHAGHGAGRLATDRIARLEVRLPTGRHATEMASLVRPLIELAAKRRRENWVLAELRDTLLPKLISGELRIRDAERQVGDVV